MNINEEIRKILWDLFPDMMVEDFGDDEKIFGEESELGLDSIDALNFIVAVETKFKVRIDEGKEEAGRIVSTINTLAGWLDDQRIRT